MTDQTDDDQSDTPQPEPAIALDVKTLKIAGAAILGVVLFVLVAAAIVNQLGDQAQTGAFATVDGVNITYGDLEQRKQILQTLGRQTQSDQTLKELLIDEQLLINEAQRQNLIPSKENVSTTIDQLIEQNNINRTRYEERLTSLGLNWSNIETYFATREGIDAVINQQSQNQTVSNETLRETYEENIESFEQPRQAQVRHILLTQPDAANDSTEELARRLLAQARNGTDFCSLVEEYSEDPGSQNCGEYNVSRQSQFVQPFIDAAFNMTEGEYRLVNSSFGYHIMVKDGELPPETRSFEEVRDQIRSQYERQQEVNTLTRIIEDLRRNATITVYEPSLENKTTAQDVVPDNETDTSNNETTTTNQSDEDVAAEQSTTDTDTSDTTTTQPVNEDFASCLADANATLYVVDWSPHSDDQLDEIGDAADEVNVVNCEDNRDECNQANITTYPTWTFNEDTRVEGYRTTTSLSQTLSCN